MYYHASPIKGITVLEPRVSNHGVPLLYFSKKRENVLVYLCNAVERYCRETGFVYNGPYKKWGPYGFDKDGRQRVEEYYPDMLKTTYQGVAGYIYYADEVKDCGYEIGIPDAVTTGEAVNVCNVEYVPDAYEAILEAERKGLIHIQRYEDVTPQKREWIRKVVNAEYEEATDHPEYRHFLQGKFGDLLDDVGLRWEAVKTEHLVQDEWIDFRRVKYRLPDGTQFEPFYNYSRRDYAVIVASDEEGKYLCVRQFRHGIGRVTTEFVAGGLECVNSLQVNDEESGANTERGSRGKFLAGAPGNVFEDALEGAKRELLEETGYVSDDWEKLITIPSNATIADNYAHVFLAKNCRRISTQNLDDTEFLNVVKLTPGELEELIHKGKFQQSVHVMAWYMAKDRAGKAGQGKVE